MPKMAVPAPLVTFQWPDKRVPVGLGRDPKYDWNAILDGKCRCFTQGKHFEVKTTPDSFGNTFRNAARRMGQKSRVMIDGPHVYAQALGAYTDEEIQELAKRRERKLARKAANLRIEEAQVATRK